VPYASRAMFSASSSVSQLPDKLPIWLGDVRPFIQSSLLFWSMGKYCIVSSNWPRKCLNSNSHVQVFFNHRLNVALRRCIRGFKNPCYLRQSRINLPPFNNHYANNTKYKNKSSCRDCYKGCSWADLFSRHGRLTCHTRH